MTGVAEWMDVAPPALLEGCHCGDGWLAKYSGAHRPGCRWLLVDVGGPHGELADVDTTAR